jgi:hypothetical protein
MTEWTPSTHKGFIIDVENNVFIKAPRNNTKTVDQIKAEHIAQKPTPPPKRQLTTTQIDKEIRDKFKKENDIEEI